MQPESDRADFPETVDAAVADALAALDSLAALGEEIDDEWQYVQDLGDAWRARIEDVAASRGAEALSPAAGRAIAGLVAEASLIRDPHRAIDWLSTLPQVALAALGERP